ncbi:glutamine--fructose-6-phosphate transaminase (isomerizing), partial [Candidatus Neomarinimicrobiota bacterium]
IIGYKGFRPVREVLIKGMHRLEYRGYDSAGIAVIEDNHLLVHKRRGKVKELERWLPEMKSDITLGMGHTRWATHGIPSDINAHPHLDSEKKIAIIHNGIIENHAALRQFLAKQDWSPESETDTEILVQYISYIYSHTSMSFPEAVRSALTHVVGAYGIVVICEDEPETMVAARLGSPLILGLGEKEFIIASDATPIIEYTRNVVYLEEGEMVVIQGMGYEVWDIQTNQPVNKLSEEIDLSLEQIEKGGHPHFMYKEIMEQAETIPAAMRGRVDLTTGHVKLGGIEDKVNYLLNSDQIYLVACGTSWHAALIGGNLIEELVGLPTKVEYASEFRYREAVIHPNTTVIAISQSGETADTLEAVRKAKERGAMVMGVVNVVGSSISRETDCGVYIHAGPEIGVASTKAFTSQVTVLALIGLLLAQHKTFAKQKVASIIKELAEIPNKIQQTLTSSESIAELARVYKDSSNFLYLGRGYQFPVALEGALKLKEISYIHAEGYPAAEMKHGPIALIDEHMPVVVSAIQDSTYDKILSNIQQIKARRGKVIAVTNEIEPEIAKLVDHIVQVPATHEILAPLLTVIPLQLLAYHIAILRGCDVDQPRNLAKSVTVE